MCQAKFFYDFGDSNSEMPLAVEASDLAQGALRRFTQCQWIGHTTSQLWGGHSTTGLSSPQSNLRRQCV